jgi:putative transposase
MAAPRGPRPTLICLTEEERTALEALVRRHATNQQIALRARIVLAAATGLNNAQIARQLGLGLDMARHWRRRWLETAPADPTAPDVEARLHDWPRPGAPAHFTAEQFCQLTALACEIPEGSDRPISHWSQREIAAEAIKRGIFASISPRHVGRFLKGGGPQAVSDPLRADPAAQRTGRRTPEQDRDDLHALPRSARPGRRGRTGDQHG